VDKGGGFYPSGRFFFGRRHDVVLYFLVLESHEWDEARDDLRYDWRGNVLMRGGWKAVAAGMTAEFGIPFTDVQCSARMKLLEDRGDAMNELFQEVSELQDVRWPLAAERARLLGLLSSLVPPELVAGPGVGLPGAERGAHIILGDVP